jgi:2-oxoglutarate ferredoxin oxidoreductase subunit beta
MKWQRDHGVLLAAYEKLTDDQKTDKFPIGVLYEKQAPEYTSEYDKVIARVQKGAK